MSEEIDKNFPMSKYRSGQKECIEAILRAFNKSRFVMVEAPCGSGKSAVAYTVSQMVKSSYYITSSKYLQDQLMTDFGENGKHLKNNVTMVDLKGRSEYPCNYYQRIIEDDNEELSDQEMRKYSALARERIMCDRGQCKKKNKSKLAYCEGFCPYYLRVDQALSSRICLMNFYSFIFQTNVINRFGVRDLLIIDEGHNIEDMLMGFIEINICDRSMLNYGVSIPELKTVEEYIKYFDGIDIYSRIKELINIARIEGDFVTEELWMSNLMRLGILKKSNPDIWIIEYIVNKDSTHTLKLKPLFINHFTDNLLFSYANKVLIMSATLLSKGVMCRSLGIHPDTCRYIALGSSFPAEVRPVKIDPVGSMTFKNKAETMPKLLSKVEELCKRHKNERGIIHTHTMEIASYIYNNASAALRYRLVFQTNFANKKEMVRVHSENSDSIIIAPAMHEGLDLKDDLGRFQIICKVPYPSKGDAQIAARMEVDPEFYDWKTSLKLLQSYGRIHRHENDHGVTYILDSEFERFYNRTKNLFPSWFREAID